MESADISRDDFANACNVVVFEHLVVDSEQASAITRHLARLDDPNSKKAATQVLKDIVKKKREKYRAEGLAQHVKLVYLFLTEGLSGLAKGQTLPGEQEEAIERAFRRCYRSQKPPMIVLGMRQLRPILALIEARSPGIQLSQFLLRPDGTGGYDTPKIAAALIQLARRAFVREEMFIRVDDDVELNAPGLVRLKEEYYRLTRDERNPHFCFSGNCEVLPLRDISCQPPDGPDYPKLFSHFVNSYSIRTTYLTNDDCRWVREEGKAPQLAPVAADPKNTPTKLNLVHAKYFIDLFKAGRWGSNLSGPLSGAGLCFSPDSLAELPPWCNADDLVMWIDDYLKHEMMRAQYGDRFESELRALPAAECPGFAQTRKKPEKFTVQDVEWSTNTYLDRLVMGCIMSYCVSPEAFGGPCEGYGALLREKDYLAALCRWRGGIAQELRAGATRHIRKVLLDWHGFFCSKARAIAPQLGYFDPQVFPPVAPPSGFAAAPATTFFNSYTIKQLMALDEGAFGLVDRVFRVLEKYLELKYQFWPHVVAVIDALAGQRRAGSPPPDPAIEGIREWMFAGLDPLAEPSPRPYQRISLASYALITRQKGKEKQWLMQWNAKWRWMNLISGHVVEGETPLQCILRELHEELFGALSDADLARMFEALGPDSNSYAPGQGGWSDPFIASVVPSTQPPHQFPEFVEFSDSRRQWTRYRFRVYEVSLTQEGLEQLFPVEPFPIPGPRKPEGPNEWVSLADIQRGWSLMGRYISPTVRRLLCPRAV